MNNLDSIYTEYIRYLAYNNYADRFTTMDCRHLFKYFKFSNNDIHDITSYEGISNYMLKTCSTNNIDVTNRRLLNLQKFIKWCMQSNYIDSNAIAIDMSRDLTLNIIKHEYINSKYYNILYSFSKKLYVMNTLSLARLKLSILLMMVGRFTLRELSTLRVSDLTSNNDERIRYLNDALPDVADTYLKIRQNNIDEDNYSDCLFISKASHDYVNLYSDFKRHRKSINLPSNISFTDVVGIISDYNWATFYNKNY